MKVTAADLLEQMAQTYRERNTVYKDNYKRFGLMMVALFPDGLNIKTIDDWNRIGIFVQICSKITRYAANFEQGGHRDSIHDTGVYSSMLEEVMNDQEEAQHDLPVSASHSRCEQSQGPRHLAT